MPKGTRQPAGTRPARRAAGHLGGRRAGRHGDADHWFTKFESEVIEYGRDLTHRGRQAQRLTYKKRSPVSHTGKTRHVRVAGRGVVVISRAAVGTAAVAVAGAYLTTRWTVRHSYRGYRAAKPYVIWVAGHAGRYAHTRGVVYGGAAARRIARMQARHRVRIRRMRYRAATTLSQLHTESVRRDWPRVSPVAARAAAAVAPRKGRIHPARQFRVFTNRSSVAGRKQEDEAIRRAQAKLDAPQPPASGGGGGVGTLDPQRPSKPRTSPTSSTPNTVRVEPSADENAAIRRARTKLAGPGGVDAGGLNVADVNLDRTPTGDPDKEARRVGLPEASPGVWKTDFDVQPPPPKPESAGDKQKRPDPAGAAPTAPTAAGSGVSSSALITPKPTSISTTGGNVSNNPAAELNKGFTLLGDFHAEDYLDWMQMLASVAGSFRTGAEAITVLAYRMDIVEKMDPRALQKLYLAGTVLGSAMQLTAGATKDFWALYTDRFESNGARGRTMRDERRFFGQR